MAGHFLDSTGGVTWSTIRPPNAQLISKEERNSLLKIEKEKRLGVFAAVKAYIPARAEYVQHGQGHDAIVAQVDATRADLEKLDSEIGALADHLGRDEAPLPAWATPPEGVSAAGFLAAKRHERPDVSDKYVALCDNLRASSEKRNELLQAMQNAWSTGIGPLTRDECVEFEALTGGPHQDLASACV